MRILIASLLAALAVLVAPAHAIDTNLLPNGNAESEWVNLVYGSKGYARHIQARDTGIPSFWRPSEAMALDREVKHSGSASLRLRSAAAPVTATTFSDYWRVKDKAMPFGTPISPGIPVEVTFWYKTSSGVHDGALSATVTLGTIADLSADVKEIPLPPATEWREITFSVTPAELRWGAQIAFILNQGADDGQSAWFDDVRITQSIPARVNLVRNPSFEASDPGGGLLAFWEPPIEDQWVSWVGARYREPRIDPTTAANGRSSMRATVTYAEVSGCSQEIRLDQDKPRLVVISLRSKLDNSVGSAPPGYYGPDNLPNLTLYVYHGDGTMQEVSPTFSLGESDHDWTYIRAGFMPQKPVERVRMQVSVIGAEATTSLWIDDVTLTEWPDEPAPEPSLASERLAPRQTLVSSWGGQLDDSNHQLEAVNDGQAIRIRIPRREDCTSTLVYLSPNAGTSFPNYHRFLYNVVRIGDAGACELGTVVEKQGYVATGEFRDADAAGVTLQTLSDVHILTVPFDAIGLAGPSDASLGFNVQWDTSAGPRFWTGRSANTDQLGTLVTAPPPGIVIRSLRFGDGSELEPDMSQDFVTHPQMNAGANRAELVLTNNGEQTRVQWQGGVKEKTPGSGVVDLAPGETRSIQFNYDAGVEGGLAEFLLTIQGSANPDPISTSFPLEVPKCIETVLDQEFYFPEETTAKLEVHNRLRPLSAAGQMVVSVVDAGSSSVLWKTEVSAAQAVTVVDIPIDAVRVNELPVQDYEVRVVLKNSADDEIATQSRPFGRIKHTQKRPLPPIKKVSVDREGRLILNDDFRFFPIMPSLSSDEPVEAVQLGANVGRAYFREGKTATNQGLDLTEAIDRAWNANAYTITIGPAPSSMEQFERVGAMLLAHPGFLGCYGTQFYYWNLPDDYIAYRHKLESAIGALPIPKLVVWGHHDSSFLYDLGRSDVTESPAPLGYCYVKIMGRPGPAWRNAPFLTRTEQVLDPHKFKLAEVNYYVSWHDDEIVPEHFKTYRSMRADDWRGFRNESYLSVIYGANGLYHYICVQQGGLQRLRGWFQELNHMWPAFASDDSPNKVSISPPGSGIEARLKEWDGRLFLITANAYEVPREATITVEGIEGWRIQKLFDLPRSMTVEGNTIRDVWNRYDAFVYEISPNKS